MGTIHEDQSTFLFISRPVLLRMNSVSNIIEKIETQFFSIVFLKHAVYEIMWKKNLERGRPQMKIWRRVMVGYLGLQIRTRSV